ncbi:MAG: methyltransferase [Treponema sp.]|nr:methyltransferase [Treponema sp.]
MPKISYITKEVSFTFRGRDFRFALSRGLFSSTDIDSGTRLLLKVFSRVLDEDAAAKKPPPRYVLDAGCGIGVIGICAAAAITAAPSARQSAAPQTGGGPLVRSQDRDELARLLTMCNAEKNGIPPSVLQAHTEPLLAGEENARWDLILSNIPAKAGGPVLKDFVRRSAGLLRPGGRVIMVAVHTLAGFFREEIRAAGLDLLQEEKRERKPDAGRGAASPPANAPAGGKPAEDYGYSVFVFGGKSAAGAAVKIGPGFLVRYPFYVRSSANYKIEGIPLRLETVYGASGFDNPGGAVQAAAKLIRRAAPEKLFPPGAPALIHEPGQGFFPRWLLEFSRREGRREAPVLVLSGRNILALEAARHNTAAAASAADTALRVVPAADLALGADALLEAAGRPYHFIAAFPKLSAQSAVPKERDLLASLWDALAFLLAGGGVFTAGFGSTEAERFDRKKPAGFTRLGDIKRKGFRALSYERR